MSAPFKGTINVDIRDSEPDWEPFEPPKAPDGAPNVVYIVLDDVGFSALSCYGGPIETPNIDKIAADGRALHAVAHDRALLADALVPADRPQPHAQQHGLHHRGRDRLPERERHDPARERHALARSSASCGWNTYMVGKWHLCPDDEMNLASTRRNWPSGRGFERWYGFLGAETNQWYPDLVYDNHLVDQPKPPEEGYHLTVDLTDKAIEFIRDAKVDRAGEAVLPLLRARRLPRAAPRAEGVDRQVQGPVRHGLRGDARADARPPEGARDRPAGHRAAADQPDRHARDAHRARRQAVPGDGRDAAVGLALGRGEGALLPDGRGLRRLPRPRRRPDRPAARLPRGVRLAREHARDRSSPTTAPAARAARTAPSTR